MGKRTGPKPIPLIERVMRRIDKQEDGCWIWTGSVDGGGYGQVTERHGVAVNIMHRCHRVVYEHLVGPIGEGNDLHHHCRVRRCCNPEHLEPVGHRSHAEHHRTDECRRCGGSDWYIRKDNGSRQCRICGRMRAGLANPRPPDLPPGMVRNGIGIFPVRNETNAERSARLRSENAERLRADPTIRPHGNLTTYLNYGCRCDECRAAARAAKGR